MTKRGEYGKGANPYGASYQRARKALLAGNPPCWWCGRPATTADHVPSLREVGHPHLNLVPSCKPCNFGRNNRVEEKVYPGPSREW